MASSSLYSEQVINLHNEMVDQIGGIIVYETDCWDRLLGMLNNSPLTYADKKSIKSIHGLFEKLMDKTYINYGDYGKLVQKLSGIHQFAASKVKLYEERIQKLVDEESSKIKKRRSSKNEGETVLRSQEDRGSRKRGRGESSGSSRTVTKAQKRTLHADMVQKLNEELSSSMVKKWASFKYDLKYKLEFGNAVLEDITDMFSACNTMKDKGIIEIGKYDQLKKVVENVDKDLVDVIDEYLKKMGVEPTPTMKRRRTSSSDDSV